MLTRLRLGERIGRGGMAEVFAAQLVGPAGFEKDVAVKRILPRLAHDPVFLERFLNEARLAARLSHPNIVQIFELGHDGNDHYIVMEAVRGKSLRAVQERLREIHDALPVSVALYIAQCLCAGLAHADEQVKLIHRDVSPHNVLLSFDGAVKLIDFGIARVRTDDRMTQVGQVLGKIRYLSPEQASDLPLDARADLFSVGVVLFEMLTGRLPFDGKSPDEVMERVAKGKRPALRDLVPELDAGVIAVVDKALATDRDQRFASAREMGAAIARAAASSPAGPHDVEGLMRRVFPDEVSRAWPVMELRGDGAEHTATQAPREIAISSEPSGNPVTISAIVDDGPTLEQATPPRAPRRAVLFGAVSAVALAAWKGAVLLMAPGGDEDAAEPPPPAPVPTRVVDAGTNVVDDAPPADPAGPPPVVETADAGAASDEGDEPSQDPADPIRRRRRPPKARPGRLVIETRPWTRVRLDGRDVGVTPLAVDVASGSHKLLLVNEESAVRREMDVKITPDGTTTLRLDLRK